MKLITENSWDVKLYEGTDKSLKIVGIFSTSDVVNANSRKYKKEILEREVNKLSEKIEKKCSWGELSHPSSPEVNPERISHIIESLEWKGPNLFGKAKILNTPMGKVAQELIREGSVGISSRGLGTVAESGYVNEDYKLITYDIVLEASNPGSAYVQGIYEAKEFDIIERPTTNKLEEAKKEYVKKLWQVLETIEKNL
jgi:hypothetical protein